MRHFGFSFIFAVLLSLATLGESSGQTIRFVDMNSTGSNDGISWENAFSSLQDALGAANSGDELWVKEGVYRPDQGAGIQLGDRDTSFVIPGGVSLYGGFSGDETSVEQRDWHVEGEGEGGVRRPHDSGHER